MVKLKDLFIDAIGSLGVISFMWLCASIVY